MDVLIKDLPDAVHQELVRRAAGRGVSLRSYLRQLLSESVAQPSLADWLQKLRELEPVLPDGLTGPGLVAAGREDDDGLLDR